jgi:hypothetical protein
MLERAVVLKSPRGEADGLASLLLDRLDEAAATSADRARVS